MAEGDTDSLGSSGKYSSLSDLTPSPLHFFMYADISGIVDMIVDGLGEDELDDCEDEVRPYVENLGAFMVASSLTEERWHFTAAMTLKE